MLYLFLPKIFFGKYFMYFSVIGVIENNNQVENIFGLTKKTFFSFEK
jgi:hypothetical protein